MRKAPQWFYDLLLLATMAWLNVSQPDYITAFVTGAIGYSFAMRGLRYLFDRELRRQRAEIVRGMEMPYRSLVLGKGATVEMIPQCTRPDWPHDTCNGWPCDAMLERIETEGKIRARFGPQDSDTPFACPDPGVTVKALDAVGRLDSSGYLSVDLRKGKEPPFETLADMEMRVAAHYAVDRELEDDYYSDVAERERMGLA